MYRMSDVPGYITELLVERAALVEIKKDERAIVVNIASCYFIKIWDQGLEAIKASSKQVLSCCLTHKN